MMIVPRAYTNSLSHRKSIEFSEKGDRTITRSDARSRSPQRSSASSTSPSSNKNSIKLKDEQRSDPVKIPFRTTKIQPAERRELAPTSVPARYAQPEAPSVRRGSARELLSATAIPVRKRPKGRLSQRLPRGDNVADFSKLLWDDGRKPGYNAGLSRSVSSSHLDGLFGSMDEILEDGQMFVGSEGVDAGILSTRSMSNESLQSLGQPDDFLQSENTSQHSSISQSIPERKLRQIAHSEDCSFDHPLSFTDDADSFGSLPELNISPPATKRRSIAVGESVKASFKSGLTASLKAIKSAAHSISTNTSTNNGVNPGSEHVLAHSFFDIQPSLTDDRRPPPSIEPPTAEMRRYLNPPPLEAAAQLHFWQDHRHSKFSPVKDQKPKKSRNAKKKGKHGASNGNGPAVVPLSTCLPPAVRTATASSPPIWLNPDGTPTNKNTATPLLYDPDIPIAGSRTGLGIKGTGHGWRNREPRENRDFLRVFVCEMQMRKSGKLSEDLTAGRARLWLPPVDEKLHGSANRGVSGADTGTSRVCRKTASERFAMINAEDLEWKSLVA